MASKCFLPPTRWLLQWPRRHHIPLPERAGCQHRCKPHRPTQIPSPGTSTPVEELLEGRPGNADCQHKPWSLQRDGPPGSTGGERYAPLTLYLYVSFIFFSNTSTPWDILFYSFMFSNTECRKVLKDLTLFYVRLTAMQFCYYQVFQRINYWAEVILLVLSFIYCETVIIIIFAHFSRWMDKPSIQVCWPVCASQLHRLRREMSTSTNRPSPAGWENLHTTCPSQAHVCWH